MVPFGGWEMPLAYPTGTIAEHLACRDDAVVFDVSHLGTVRVAGDGCVRRAAATLTNDLGKIAPGRAQYTHLLDDADASVLDDIIVWWHPRRGGADAFDVMPNASNTDRVRAAVGGDETTHDRAVLAVQGPQAARAPRRACSPRPPRSAASGSPRPTGTATPCTVAGTGYTGERGVEIAVPADAAGDLWEAIVAAGVRPAGLGARDTLRLEAGLPLHGHELGPGITSLQAGLGWVVAWDKPEFRGRAALAPSVTRGVSPPPGRHRHRGSTPAPRRLRRARRRGDVGVGHERQLLARARPRHRPRLPAAGLAQGTRSMSTCVAATCPATSWRPRSCGGDRRAASSAAAFFFVTVAFRLAGAFFAARFLAGAFFATGAGSGGGAGRGGGSRTATGWAGRGSAGHRRARRPGRRTAPAATAGVTAR